MFRFFAMLQDNLAFFRNEFSIRQDSSAFFMQDSWHSSEPSLHSSCKTVGILQDSSAFFVQDSWNSSEQFGSFFPGIIKGLFVNIIKKTISPQLAIKMFQKTCVCIFFKNTNSIFQQTIF